MDVLDRISEYASGHTKSQRKISNYILKNFDNATSMTAEKLADSVGVSSSTVVRYATELGYKGYPELKRALSEAQRIKLTSVQRIHAAAALNSEEEILNYVMGNDVERLRTALEEIDGECFKSFVDSIIDADSVYISGMRTSIFLADILGFYLNYLRPNVRVIYENEAATIYEQMFHICEKDLFIGISFPRYSAFARSAMEYAKSKGAKVIAITDCKASPLYGVAELSLFARSEMASFLDSLVAPLSLINALVVAIGARCPEKTSKAFETLENVWDKYKVYEKK